MIKSMTGFGRAEMVVNEREITVEIKSVNHRYFEFSARTPRGYGFLDDKLKSFINSKVSRGKIECFVSINCNDSTPASVTVNHNLVSGYINAMNEICDTYKIDNDVSVMNLSKFSDVLTVHKTPADEEEIIADVLQVTNQALESFISMRETEGEKMKQDIQSRANTILNIVCEVEQRSPETIKAYEARLFEKIKQTLTDCDVNIDTQRILTEVAVFSDKVAVAEETVRLRSHFDQLQEFLNYDIPVGRKIDFLIQEMNREANTIGSKVQDTVLSHKVVDIKCEIEKIREQVQNIE